MSYKPSLSIAMILALACSSGAASLAAACETSATLDGTHRAARGAASYVPPSSESLPIPRIARGTSHGNAGVTAVSDDSVTAIDPARRAARGG